ncbi:MAG: DUF72 domain-containing protein [Verrucomicrobiota bacterium]
MPFDRIQAKSTLQALAGQGVYVGTSSWKYPGWLGPLYEEARYDWRGKFSASRFERNCLAEYASVFKTVCVDAAYYKFPDRPYLQSMMSEVPDDFRFAFKVTDEITLKKFGHLPRFGARAGQPNEHFLNADLFTTAFLGPCAEFKPKIGILIFEFSKFYASDYAHGVDFITDLDGFLSKLPKDWPYGVEIRNPQFLRPGYFETLRRHGAAHVFNAWTDMPRVGEQMALPESRTNPSLTAARFLLKAGRKYEEAVRTFQPYDRTREVNDEAREAGRKLIAEGVDQPAKKTFIFVNNRLEGNALETIAAMLEQGEPQRP